jgi:hypothetical protein
MLQPLGEIGKLGLSPACLPWRVLWQFNNLNNKKMANAQIQLQDDSVLEIDFISTEKYKDKLADGKTDNKLAGKEYHRYRYNGKIFTTRDENFVKAMLIGDVFKVTLQEVIDGDATYLEFVSFIPYTKKVGLERNKAQLRQIQEMTFAPTVFTAELANDIA